MSALELEVVLANEISTQEEEGLEDLREEEKLAHGIFLYLGEKFSTRTFQIQQGSASVGEIYEFLQLGECLGEWECICCNSGVHTLGCIKGDSYEM
ncbi:MAG: hypothetical protein N2442_09065 [Spirochaetes bacterium]|nr:hypothetical protein [Spirochaetota bacterium]